MIAEQIKITGSGKGREGWFDLAEVNISFDHPFDAPFEHALNLDFVNEGLGPGARIAVELSERAARDLVTGILAVLDRAGKDGVLEAARP
jgi:hypothetical protein